MGLFKKTPAEKAAVTVAELQDAARELNAGDSRAADALVERGGKDAALRRAIAMQVLSACVDEN